MEYFFKLVGLVLTGILGAVVFLIVLSAVLLVLPFLFVAHLCGMPFYVTKKDIRIHKYMYFRKVPLSAADEAYNRAKMKAKK